MEDSFPEGDGGEWFGDDPSTLRLLYILFMSLLRQPHLRSSGIRSRRLGLLLWKDSLKAVLMVTVYATDQSQPREEARGQSLELPTETSVVSWMGKFTCLKQSSGDTVHCVQQTAGRTWRQYLLWDWV